MYEDEGYKLMGAAFEVYNELGYGMAEEKLAFLSPPSHPAPFWTSAL